MEQIIRDATKDLAPIPIPSEWNRSAPVYLNYAKDKTDQDSHIRFRVKKAHLKYRNFDPNETPRLSALEAIRNVAQSYGVLLHLIPSEHADAMNHNLRAAFLAGLADGLKRELLLIQYSDTPVPLDCRDAVTYSPRPENIEDAVAHTVVFLRNDVYELLVDQTPDRGKETRANVDWSEPDLLREMIKRRVVFSFPELDESTFSQIWQQMCVPLIHGEESSQYLIDRSLMRPRNLIELIGHCRGYAVNLHHKIIQEEEDVANGLKAYSTDLLRDISLEIRDILPAAQDVTYGFIESPAAFSHETLTKMISDTGISGERLQPIYEILLWFGFLGVIWPSGEAKYIYSFNYDAKLFKAAISRLERSGISYQVNPAFWSALGIAAV